MQGRMTTLLSLYVIIMLVDFFFLLWWEGALPRSVVQKLLVYVHQPFTLSIRVYAYVHSVDFGSLGSWYIVLDLYCVAMYITFLRIILFFARMKTNTILLVYSKQHVRYGISLEPVALKKTRDHEFPQEKTPLIKSSNSQHLKVKEVRLSSLKWEWTEAVCVYMFISPRAIKSTSLLPRG